MTAPATITCKPTPWFLFRAVVMLLLFGVFAVLFYRDGSTGYRKKNEIFYLHKTFEQASNKFLEAKAKGPLTPAEWKMYAAKQTVDFPDDRAVLPSALELPMPWPAILQDYAKMETQWNLLWREYTKDRGLDATTPEEPYDAQKIKEQWIVFGGSALLSLVAAFFLIRTVRRSISVDGEALTTQLGQRIPFADLKSLDLRKWETKGLAFIEFDGPSGKGTVRIDGLTYGGFKKENDEPAERLMHHLRERFSGEIIEYTTVPEGESSDDPATPAA